MKSFFLLIVILIVLSFSLCAQPYQPFHKTDKVHYTYLPVSPIVLGGGDWYFPDKIFYEVCNVDSTAFINADSIFYFNPTFPKNLQSSNNFLGDKMLKRNNGDYCFINENDTIALKMNVVPGSSWQHTNGIHSAITTITYKGKNYYQVYDTDDSVMVFEVQAPDYMDSIVLSKSYGMIHTFALFATEHLTYDQSYNYKKSKGTNKLNFLDYYDFEVGDLFLYNKYASAWTALVTEKTYLNILSKEENVTGDTVEYDISICRKPENSSASWYSGTLKVTEFGIINFPVFFETPLHENINELLNVPFTSRYECMMDTIEHNVEFSNTSYFYTYEISHINQGLVEFKEKTGFTYVRTIAPYDESSELLALEGKANYIPTGNETSLLEVYEHVLGNAESSHMESLSLFPNPSKDELSIGLPKNMEGEVIITVFNSIGEKVYETNIKKSGTDLIKIDLLAMSSGYHFIRVENGNKSASKSFVKQ